ncbi:MAG: PilZ domain-containing protein [Amaricoccus sp.]|uniref:PilZ domain-containing protein n=1 Tax=Amaricoccus sp. TaxID=1872485 RepID=UPI0039E2F93D
MEDRRTHRRARVLRRAKIVFSKGRAAVDCVVLDLSPGGARLRLGPMLGVPDGFELRIENGPVHAARVAYRAADATGICFEAA